VTKFNGVHSIDLHLPSNFGANATKIHFIGFKGEHTEVIADLPLHVLWPCNHMSLDCCGETTHNIACVSGNSDAIIGVLQSQKRQMLQGKREAVIAVYEAKPLVSDHKLPGDDLRSGHDIV